MGIAELAEALKFDVVFVYQHFGFFDESEDQTIFCLAGLFGPMHQLRPFEKAWGNLVGEYDGLEEFHTEECLGRKGFWENWAREARSDVQQRFVDLLTNDPVLTPPGLAVAIDLAAYAHCGRPEKPWHFAFSHALDGMLAFQRLSNKTTGQAEELGLIFDKKKGFQGRAQEIIDAAPDRASLTFADSKDQPLLQAADLLVYEARRFLSEAHPSNPQPKPLRDQWSQLMNAKGLSGQQRTFAFYWDEAAIGRLDMTALKPWDVGLG
jgi:hypothetical protein